jgi:hypothetical protein
MVQRSTTIKFYSNLQGLYQVYSKLAINKIDLKFFCPTWPTLPWQTKVVGSFTNHEWA